VAAPHELGRWPANLIHDGSEEVLAAFPHASGAVAPVKGTEASSKTANAFGEFAGRAPSDRRDGGGSAARFFYCAKASRADRNEGLPSSDTPAVGTGATMREREDADWPARNGNHHPTVKPTDLMRYLCRLVTPAGGIVLDPFMGSGSTGKAAVLEGFRFIGIERDPEYIDIARARIAHAEVARAEATSQSDLFLHAQSGTESEPMERRAG
jgi:site-specific DNA-methyltransferase (adenine-specific)